MMMPYAYGEPLITATTRSTPEDFQVDEILGFALDGEGEHQFLHIRKRNTNTEWVARQLARLAKVKPVDVSYAGLKDRHAVTTQWFSVRLAGKPAPHWHELASGDMEFLEITRHSRKLKRGALKGNHFSLTLRNIKGDLSGLEQCLSRIAKQGVPNYFGEQRFGFNNLAEAKALFAGQSTTVDRHQQKLYISAARSFLFNQVLAARIQNNTWNKALLGEIFMLEGTHSIFRPDAIDSIIQERLEQQDIHTTGPLFGMGNLTTQDQALAVEQAVLDQYPELCAGLAAQGLKQERRALRLVPKGFTYQFLDENQLRLEFELAAGCYATAVLREICHYTNAVTK